MTAGLQAFEGPMAQAIRLPSARGHRSEAVRAYYGHGIPHAHHPKGDIA